MIIGSDEKLPIGFRGIGLSDPQGRMHDDQPFVVIREATAEEYFADDRHSTMPASQVRRILSGRAFFYEVSID